MKNFSTIKVSGSLLYNNVDDKSGGAMPPFLSSRVKNLERLEMIWGTTNRCFRAAAQPIMVAVTAFVILVLASAGAYAHTFTDQYEFNTEPSDAGGVVGTRILTKVGTGTGDAGSGIAGGVLHFIDSTAGGDNGYYWQNGGADVSFTMDMRVKVNADVVNGPGTAGKSLGLSGGNGNKNRGLQLNTGNVVFVSGTAVIGTGNVNLSSFKRIRITVNTVGANCTMKAFDLDNPGSAALVSVAGGGSGPNAALLNNKGGFHIGSIAGGSTAQTNYELEWVRVLIGTAIEDSTTSISQVNGQAATPVISPAGGAFVLPTEATITCATDGAAIHYTTDGSNPSQSSTQYTEPIPITELITIKAQAYGVGYDNSGIIRADFTFRDPIAIRVKPTEEDGDDTDDDGLTWATAIESVQAGIDLAATVPGDMVWVKTGTYNENIRLEDYVQLYGGFAGTDGEQLTDRDWVANETILDGGFADRVVMINGSSPAGTTIDGFIIQNGDGDGDLDDDGGGGICVGSFGSPTISNNTIRGNDGSSYGGGIYCGIDSAPIIKNNLIYDNTAGQGAGIYCDNSSATITNNTVVENTADTDGGGIGFSADTTDIVANNIFALNTNGGVYNDTGTPTLRNNCVYGNTGENDYVGIAQGTDDIVADPEFVNSAGDDFHLLTISPCIDTGNDGDADEAEFDMDKQGRKNDFVAGGTLVDIGADEVYQVAALTFDPDGASWNTAPQDVTITCAEADSIHYTTNGDEPTTGDPAVVSGGTVSLSANCTLRAKAFKAGYQPSEKSADFTFTVATPTFDPESGSAESVTVTCTTDGAVIHYTTTGIDPIEADPTVDSGSTVDITQNMTLKARAFKANWTASAVATSGAFTRTVATPTFDPTGGTFKAEQEVTITCATGGAVIYYTTDGTDPDEDSEEYTDPITVSATTTIKAKAYKTDWDASEVASTRFVISRKPRFDIDKNGTDDLAGLTDAEKIYYSTNKTSWIRLSGHLSYLTTGDLDGDGSGDIIGTGTDETIWYTTDKASWNNITGNLRIMASRDYDGDGDDDLAGVSRNRYPHWSTDKKSWTRIQGLLANITAGDLDADGKYDLIGLSSGGNIYYSTDKISWTQVPGFLATITSGNVNGDNNDDIIGLDADGTIWYTTDIGTWTHLPQVLSKLYVGDVNGDGSDDLIGLKADNSIWYTLDGTNWVQIPGHLSALAVGDLNGDGADDIAGLGTAGSIWSTTDKTSWTKIPGTLSKIYSAR